MGNYSYTLSIVDTRPNSSTATAAGRFAAQSVTGRQVYQRTSWNTIWQRPPTAKMTWTGSTTANVPLSVIGVGQNSATVNFSAAASTNDPRNINKDPLTYFWDFGDGTTSTEANPVHVFNQTKPYLITLTVKNKDGLTDKQQVYYHIRDFKYKTLLRGKYPGATTLAAQSLKDMTSDFTAEELNHIYKPAAEAKNFRAQSILTTSPSPTDDVSDGYFPYVLPENNFFTDLTR